jgi:ATP-binding cassette, subfamily B, bacterial MsbA
LLLVSMTVTPFGCYLIHYLAKRMRSAASHEMQGYAAVFQTLMDTIGGIKLVKIFTRHRRERRRFKRNSTSLHQMTMRISFYDAIVRPINEVLAMVVLCVAILAGAMLVLNQETHLFGIPISTTPLTASQLFTFFAMLAGIADPARKLGDIYNSLFRATMASQSLYNTFEDLPLLIGPENPERTPLHQKAIRFENITFGYHAESPVLNNINLEIPFGQTIALVGVNGSGKSTITNLLARFYDPQQGTITLDGVDLRKIRPRQLWKQMAIVTQDPILFRGTIFMNIRYGNQAATKADVERAAKLAHVTDFIHEIPRGFQGQVGDRGNFLSGGQRQRVALARAILADPRILILDEATSQMDAQVEVSIHESLRSFLQQRTTILITHRISTLTLADRVVVLKSGRIVEDVQTSHTRWSKDHFLSLLAKAA